MKTYPRVLTVAGSDSGGGAGIQADIKAISATGSYAASAITAVTVQNTLGVQEVAGVEPRIVGAQIDSVLSDIGADAVKIGMLHSREIILSVRDALVRNSARNIVLDPVMVSTSGHTLIREDAIEALCTSLIPLARIITPNLPEAEVLCGHPIPAALLREAAVELSRRFGGVSVLLKAGHLEEESSSTDIFYNAEEERTLEFPSERIRTPNTHGTGCTLSSALASFLAQGRTPDDAVREAKLYISRAIVSGAQYTIGHGHGPVNHFFAIGPSPEGRDEERACAQEPARPARPE